MSVAAPAGITVGENITSLHPYRPGKPIEEVQRELGLSEVIKLASNENALGPSPRALRAIQVAAESVHLYPNAVARELSEAVSTHLRIPADHLIFGNGSDDIIHLLGLTFLAPGDEVIQADPTFVRYEAAAILNQAVCHKVPLRWWTHDLEAMAERVNDRTRLIFISNPNNPTGTIVTDAQVNAFMTQVPDRAIVVFDEAYFEFVESADFPRSIKYVKNGLNVVVLRTYSKAYGLAGIRLGYGISTPEIIHHLNQVREPFNVSSIAQAAGVAALEDNDFLQLTLKMNRDGKALFHEAFRRLELSSAPTEGNFVWVDVGRPCVPVFEALLRKGIIVRTGDIFSAPTHLRVTIGTADQNERFLNALEEVLKR